RFQGTIKTDGVGVSILKQNTNVGKKQSSMKNKMDVGDQVVDYIKKVSPKDLKKHKDDYVTIDPGRRYILLCMK
ncbi:uncharacterized protein EV154DRAFT_427614, partial [Mucor mucedo]|uniref:uncharacterized protein n=1 Tax=Mucor mucedo TaxID=29922 RepID=UPI0022202B05